MQWIKIENIREGGTGEITYMPVDLLPTLLEGLVEGGKTAFMMRTTLQMVQEGKSACVYTYEGDYQMTLETENPNDSGA